MSTKKQKNIIILSFEEQEMFLKAFYEQDLSFLKNNSNNYQISEKETFINTVMQQGVILKEEDYKLSYKECKKVSKKYFDSSIDLHGFCRVEARKKLLEFIEKSKIKGCKNLLIIHGKGSGIIKNVVYDVIRHHQDIKNFKKATLKLGGSGSVLIYLKE